MLASGAAGYGGAVLLQNAGIARTSVSHAALLIGATPVLVAVIAALWHRAVARPVAWAGFALSLVGVGLVTGGGGGGATVGGDGLVLASLLLSAMFTVAQDRLLRGRDPVAVTAVQFLGAALAVLPFSVVAEGMPAAPGAPGPVLAAAGLVAGGTLLPFTLFAYGQSRVSATMAGAFLNLEPFVGAVAGIVIFGDPAGPEQVAGGAAILAGLALSNLRPAGPARKGRAETASGGRLSEQEAAQAADADRSAQQAHREQVAGVPEQAGTRVPQGQRPQQRHPLVQRRVLHHHPQRARVDAQREERRREQEQRDLHHRHVVEVLPGTHERGARHPGAGEREADQQHGRQCEHCPGRMYEAEGEHHHDERRGIQPAADERPGDLAERDRPHGHRRGKRRVVHLVEPQPEVHVEG
jgi:drug/metabolite transporter (DMT)-like permease